jgi:NIMA-interacting peptidyl-prolyl cis-trans isomerase 1
MQREFELAAFALQKGEVSARVETASGVHLIQRWDHVHMSRYILILTITQHRLE